MTDYRAYITHRCMLIAGNLGVVEYGVEELGKLPSHVVAIAQAKVHELAREAAHRAIRGDPESEIKQHIEREL